MKTKKVDFLRILYCVAAMAVLMALDQATKMLALKYLSGKGIVKVVGDYAIFEFIKNRGAFLSVGHELGNLLWTAVFVIIPLLVLTLISIYVIATKTGDRFFLAMWVLVMSGGLGNLVDRIREGQVVDFMNVGIGRFRTGIFNVADLYIVAFVVIIAVKFLASGSKSADVR